MSVAQRKLRLHPDMPRGFKGSGRGPVWDRPYLLAGRSFGGLMLRCAPQEAFSLGLTPK